MSKELMVLRRESTALATLPKEVARDERDILDILKSELNFVEHGGYGRSVRTPWLATTVFQDSPSCFCFPNHDHEGGCALMKFVPKEHRLDDLPCHHIPLNKAGETLDSLKRAGNQEGASEVLKRWLQTKISELEIERTDGKPVSPA
jgi:hypothetical protein